MKFVEEGETLHANLERWAGKNEDRLERMVGRSVRRPPSMTQLQRDCGKLEAAWRDVEESTDLSRRNSIQWLA
jgi:hypothetical protein